MRNDFGSGDGKDGSILSPLELVAVFDRGARWLLIRDNAFVGRKRLSKVALLIRFVAAFVSFDILDALTPATRAYGFTTIVMCQQSDVSTEGIEETFDA